MSTIIQEAIKIRSIAHVGHSGTQDDFMRVCEMLSWLDDFNYCMKGVEPDFVCASKGGRDFLAETKRYDAVVLHFLFRGGFCVPPDKCKGQLYVSPLNSWSAWRKRLSQTGANVIFAFGGPSEVNGTHLVNLEGYDTVKMESNGMSVFVRKAKP